MRIRSGMAKRAGLAATTLVVVMSLTACSDDDDSGSDPELGPEPSPEAVMTSRLEVGEVTGRLPKKKRQAVRADAGKVVTTWIEAAYFSGSPRPKLGDAFPGFTQDAERLARRDKWLLSNATLAERFDEVVPVGPVKVKVDILAPKGRVAGVTARFRVLFDAVAGQSRRVTVRGRVMLIRNDRGNWKIFGYDAARWSKAPKGEQS